VDPELEELARLSQLDEQLSVMRHDLRNRLNGIRNGVFYLRRKSEGTALWREDERFPTFFDLIEQEVHKGEETLSSRASVESVLPRKLEPQLLEVGIERGLAQHRAPDGIRVETEYAQTEPTSVWEAEIALLTHCLVENAVEAVRGRDPAIVRVRSRSDGDGAWLVVEDNGPGLSRGEVAAAIQPFRTQKPGHLGIGLNVARRIVQRYGGRLAFGEAEGGGLCVECCLP
jgi:signal transduction histidine kinase